MSDLDNNRKDTIKDEEFYRAYFGKDSDYYIGVLKQKGEGRGSRFNIYAFLFGLLWIAYRKMYIVAIAYLLLTLMINKFIRNQGVESDAYSFALSFGLATVLGLFGNNIYIWNATKNIERVKKVYTNDKDIETYLSKTGGTSYFAILAISLLFMLFLSILISVFGMTV